MAINLPTGSGNTGTNDWADVYVNDAQLVTEIDARDDNYQTIFSAIGGLGGGQTAATFCLGSHGTVTNTILGTVNYSVGSNNSTPVPLFYFDDADYTIASKTQKLRVRAQIACNATAPAITFTVGLYPVTVAGTTDVLTHTLGTVTSGSTAASASPSASAVAQVNSGDFTIPSDGAFVLGVVTSGTIATNSAVSVNAQLQTRWV